MQLSNIISGFNTVIAADSDNTIESFVFGFYEQYAQTPDKTLPCLWVNQETGTYTVSDDIITKQITLTAVCVVAYSESSTLEQMYDSAEAKGSHVIREYLRHYKYDTPDDPIWLVGNIDITPQPIVDEQKSIGVEFKCTVGFHAP